jgi:NADH-quinone oxidoreductase subunit L
MNPNLNLWLIPVLPLVGAAINGFFGKKSPRSVVTAIALFFSAAAFAMALSVVARFSSLALPYHEYVAHWIRSGSFTVNYEFYLDELSLVMLLVVTGVGFLIHLYSVGYMWDDPSYYRFFAYLNLFLFFMLTLILAGNYLQMFIGWEGVGLASYLLIGFWFTKDSAASAGKKAFIVNRIGDFGFLIALFLLIQHFGTLNFTGLFQNIAPMGVEKSGPGLLTAVGILLMVGACGKSAQIPLYIWLPDAMEGPTPVSALIHAATMVTAGVYMVSRSHVIFERAPIALTVVAIIGTLTAFFAATIGIAQTDIKKVLAYSTVSQLGYMFMACGVGAFSAGIFHLMTHAFFKGLLFLGAGSVIHAVGGEQDMRKMGGLRKKIPWTFWTVTAGTLAIAGIPGLAGFFSKDEILWRAYQASWIYWLVGLITAFITSFYMFRLWFMTFFGEYRGETAAEHGHDSRVTHSHDAHDSHGHGGVHESPKVMVIPLVILALLSVFGGYVGVPGSLGGNNRFDKFLGPVFHATLPASGSAAEVGEKQASERETEGPEPSTGVSTELTFTGISVLVALLGFGLAWLLYYRSPQLPAKIAASMTGMYQTLVHKYYVDEFYGALFVRPLINGSTKILWQDVDRKMIDAAVNESGRGARAASEEVREMQSGNIRSYAGWVAAGSAVVIGVMIWMWTGAR